MKQGKRLESGEEVIHSSVFNCSLSSKPKVRTLYWVLLLIIATILGVSIFVKIDISVSSRGIVRSPEENISIESN